MPKIPIAHDFSCPWCWVGLLQAQKLQAEFGVEIDWLGYELWPEGLDPAPSTNSAPPAEVQSNRPKTPTRMQLAYAAMDIDRPSNYFKTPDDEVYRTHNAHEAIEYAKALGCADDMADRLYRAYWTQATDINDVENILRLADGIVPDLDDLRAAIAEKRYADNIVGFDDDAYAAGVYNVPTFFIGGERYAEQPYRVLAAAVRELAPTAV